MKVCILTQVWPQPFDTRIFHKHAKSLVEAGYDVTFIVQHDKDEVVDGVKIVALPKPKNRLWRALRTCWTFNLALKQKADVYHIHDPELIPVAVLLKLINQAKIIYDVHEDVAKQILTKEWIPHYLRPLVSVLYSFVERISFPLFDAITATAEDVVSHLPQSSKVGVIGNFPSLEIARHAGGRHRRRGEGEPALLIYVGWLVESRGAREMVEAVTCLSGKARLVLVGTIPDSRLEDELRAKASKEVQFVGQVPHTKVFSLMRGADIGLVCFHPTPNNVAASWRNNKLFEYMAAGLPIIASNFPLWKEIVEGNNCGLTVNPLDPREIAKAVEYLMGHQDEAKKMGENGRRAILEKYNWENESKKLLDIYEMSLKK